MDEQQLAQLQEWARRLQRAGDSAELRAAGRALDLATAEIERLRAQLDSPAPVSEDSARSERPRRRGRRPFDLEADDEEEAEPLVARLRRSLLTSASPDGANGGNGQRARVVLAEPPQSLGRRSGGNGHVAAAPAAAGPRRRPRPPAVRLPLRGTLVAASIAAVAVAGGFAAVRLLAPELDLEGPPPDARIGAANIGSLSFSAQADDGTLRETSWVLDGRDVKRDVVRRRGAATLAGASFPDGEHWLTVRADGWLPGSRTEHTWHFTIDRSAPVIRIDKTARKAPVAQPLIFSGTTDAGSEVRVNDRLVSLPGRRFAVRFPEPPSAAVRVEVTDPFGNSSSSWYAVQLVPRTPRAPLRAVHVTFYGWADPALRRGVLDLIEQGKIDAVELDLKDESGTIGFDAPIPLGRQIGAVKKIYDLPQAIRMLHARGVMVVGRIVAFRDPVHATAAWRRGWRAQVVQTGDGGPYAGYGGFTNFASPAVRKYNIDVARVAAQAGIDDVLYDYVRRPDGPTSSMRFPGLRGAPEKSVADFLAEARAALKPYGTFLGASVFGVAATRPTEVAQNINAMARNVDYIAPMLYPSHWGPGEYDVAHPNGQPYAIVRRSLRDFQRQVRGTGARVVPWLQDFSLGVTYGRAEVAAQIRATQDAGIDEWLLWDPHVTYTGAALPQAPQLDPITTKRVTVPTRAAPSKAKRPAAAAVRPNELGEVPVLMYHQIRADGGGDYDLTPAQFRAELTRLWREGYWPVRAIDFVTGRMDVPAGKTPVVMTFDDSTKEQLSLDENGEARPNTAIGIMLAFQKKHPKFEPAGTFFVNREPFAGVAEGPQLLRWLNEHGFEIGNHTKDHIPLNQLDAKEVQRQLALGQNVITNAVPDAEVLTLSLPLGEWPTPRSLAWRGSWKGQEYRHAGVFKVGAEAAKSPFSHEFDPHAIPRIRTTPRGAAEPEWGSSWWLDILKRELGRRYVSDGDPSTIAFPKTLASRLADRFQSRAKPY